MRNSLYKTIIIFVFVFIVLSIWILFPEIYFRLKFKETYSEKAIFAKRNELLRGIDIVQEVNLQPPIDKPSFSIDIPLNEFRPSKGVTTLVTDTELKLIPQTKNGKHYLQARVLLNDDYLALISQYKYSLSFSIFCDSYAAKTSSITIFIGNRQINSAPNLDKQDILTAVAPTGEALRKNKFIIRLNSYGSGQVIFKNPKMVLTPIYPNFINKNYRETFNFKKGKRRRIVIIGGSTTYGTDSTVNCTWPSILQQKLEYLYPDMFEVINLGTWGGSISDFIEGFKTILWQRIGKEEYRFNPESIKNIKRYTFGYKDLEADLVILSVAWNDIAYSLMTFYLKQPFLFGKSFLEIEETLVPKLCNTAVGFFTYRALYRLMALRLPIPLYINKEAMMKEIQNVDTTQINYAQLFQADAPQVHCMVNDFKKNLGFLINSFKRQNVDVCLVILPSLVYARDDDYIKIKRLGWNERFFLLNCWSYGLGGLIERKAMYSLSDTERVKLYDTSFIFADEPAGRRNELFVDMIHPTALGNNYISSTILPYLIRDLNKEPSYE